MNGPAKYIVLILTIIVPVGIYLFLEAFGENKYVIPLYYQDDSKEVSSSCVDISFPYRINFRETQYLPEISGDIKVFNVVSDECFDCPPNLNEVKRLIQKHSDIALVNILWDDYSEVKQSKPFNHEKSYIVRSDSSNFHELIRCKLLIEEPVDSASGTGHLVLLDKQSRIRGYYQGKSRTEMDRLILEISILKEEE